MKFSNKTLRPFREAAGLANQSLGYQLVPTDLSVYDIFSEYMCTEGVGVASPESTHYFVPLERVNSFVCVIFHHFQFIQ